MHFYVNIQNIYRNFEINGISYCIQQILMQMERGRRNTQLALN